MEPIISPWIIYTVSLVNKAWICALVTLFLSPVYFLVIYLGCAVEEECFIEKGNSKKYVKYGAYAVLIALITVIVLPTKDTMIAMLVSSYITPDNIALVQDNLVDFVKRIMEVVNSNGK